MSHDFQHSLDTLRSKIDLIDRQIIESLVERMNVSKEIGKLKKKENITQMSLSRQSEIIKKLSSNLQGSEELISSIYLIIFEHSIKIQKSIFNE
jgi:chorismate mutase